MPTEAKLPARFFIFPAPNGGRVAESECGEQIAEMNRAEAKAFFARVEQGEFVMGGCWSDGVRYGHCYQAAK